MRTTKLDEAIRVTILPECYNEIMYYVNKSSVEISGMGKIEIQEDGSMVVTKIYLLDQENGPATTDIDADAMSTLLYETRGDKGSLNFWWHSHVDMPVFWSNTDMDTIRQFGKNGYLLATVFNKKNEYRTAYFQGMTDFMPEIFVDDITTGFTHVAEKDTIKKWEENFKARAKEKKYTAPTHTGSLRGFRYDPAYRDDALGFEFEEKYMSEMAHEPVAEGYVAKDHGTSSTVPVVKVKGKELTPLKIGSKEMCRRRNDLTMGGLYCAIEKLLEDCFQNSEEYDDIDIKQRMLFYDAYEILYGNPSPNIDEVKQLFDTMMYDAEAMTHLEDLIYQVDVVNMSEEKGK